MVDGTVMVDEVPVAVELYYGLMVVIGIACYFIQNALGLPRAVNAAAHGVAYLFGEFRRIRQVVPVAALVNPRSLGVSGKVYRNYRTVKLDHVRLELCIVALCITPEDVGLAVIVDKHCGVYVVPSYGSVLGGHVVGHESRASGIDKRSERTVGDSDSDRLAGDGGMFNGDIPVKLAVTLYDLTCPCVTLGPLDRKSVV